MIEVKVKDAALREAAMQDMDAFLGVFINATKEAIGGELNAENMQQLSVAQITLLAYDILHEEVGVVFGHVLDNAGVFKWDEAGRAAQQRFIDSL